MTDITESSVIAGVKVVSLRAFGDDRGLFMETFRKEWFPERSWNIIQCNRSDSSAGVLRGLHYHHKQVDYWHVSRGAVRIALADLRQSSGTYGAVQTLDVNQNQQIGVLIPVGVAHGFLAKTVATLTYIVDNYYDGSDEYGVAWNDSTLNIEWGTVTPSVSGRDGRNRLLRDIPSSDLPD